MGHRISNWKTLRLGELCEKIDYGITASAVHAEKGPRFLRITDIQDQNVNWNTVPSCVATERERTQARLQIGDIVFARTGATTGKSFLIRECPVDAVFASYLIRVRPSNRIDPIFLSHYFNSPVYWAQIDREAQGAGQPGVNSTKLRSLSIPLPPLPEQHRIAKILDKADAVRRKRQEAVHNLGDCPHSLFLEMFGHPDSNQSLWPRLLFSEVCDSRLGKMLDAKHQTGNDKRPYMRNFNVQWGRLDMSSVFEMDFDKRDRSLFRLQYGDVLICEGGAGVGQTAIWYDELPECYFQKSLHRARPYADKATPAYIAYLMWTFMKAASVVRSISSATIPHLTGEKLKVIPIPVPPIALQKQFQSRCEKYEQALCRQNDSVSATVELFDALVQQAFSGNL